jgi:hypothetical protein
MKRVFSRRVAAALCALALASVAGCGDDSNPASGDPANTGSVSGTVSFTGAWPATGDIQIAVYSTLPPAGPPDGYTNPLNPTVVCPAGSSCPPFDFTISGLDPGTYDGIIVSWRDPSDPLSAEIIGDYQGSTPVTVIKGETATGFDILADLDQAGP